MSLDLSLALLRLGRPGEVPSVAEEMLWIFEAQGVPREALAALQLYRDAAQRAAASEELTRQVVRFLHRSVHDPELRFELQKDSSGTKSKRR